MRFFAAQQREWSTKPPLQRHWAPFACLSRSGPAQADRRPPRELQDVQRDVLQLPLPAAAQADIAYSSHGNHDYLRKRNITAVIPEKQDQAANRKKKGNGGGRPVRHDADLYKERNTVERLINKLKAWRCIATRYDKTPENYLAGLHLRASMI
ncbi:DDE family transposase [Streptomyces sp. Ag82_O1-15]|nr:transposase [Streptomyces sp. Ag82_O1-15]PBC98697.1 DDE family transposase [Streptomyces sp. Ag82_O1-15]